MDYRNKSNPDAHQRAFRSDFVRERARSWPVSDARSVVRDLRQEEHAYVRKRGTQPNIFLGPPTA